MLLALGAVSSAMDALQSLTSSKSSSHAIGLRQRPTNPFDLASSSVPESSAPVSAPSGLSRLSPATMTALLAAQAHSSAEPGTSAPTSRSVALNHLFSHLDADRIGGITQSEFGGALGAGGTNLANADEVFRKLDTDADGSISLQELTSALRGGKSHRPHHAGTTDASNDQSGSSDPLLQALSGASSSSVTNSDGSTTTSVTYADGSKVTLTTPAARTASGSATSSHNFIEQAIAREAQAIASGANTSLALKV